jgi:hypothetical protein
MASDSERLRDQAAHARTLAMGITDTHARAALNAYAEELERQAAELDPASSRSDDP